MKKIVLTAVLSAIVFTYVGYVIGLSNRPICTRKHQNFIDDGRIVIIPVDTVEGRKTFNVLFSDEEGMDSMYPEEIGLGLATGRWAYNEDLEIK
jgi:hypothetical protein